eukprot:TRINITY_DN3257_c0_g1_i1.p1 TRINITY_DN3257_c0_g1~~TRINITY_DN3257_c0_g1_i1.p1  ORF type:complete len:542 (+),score=64.08 TRINITY_DN3257_c0_g1_i1:109-1626(+)
MRSLKWPRSLSPSLVVRFLSTFANDASNAQTPFFKHPKPIQRFPGDNPRWYLCHQREPAVNYIGQPMPLTHPHLMKPGELLPGISFEEFAKRRKALMDSLPSPAVVLLSGNSTQYMSNDIPYLFRQDTDFLYLTGCQEPDSVMLLRKDGNDSFEYVLFVRARDLKKEMWEGVRTGVERAKAVFGADRVFESNDTMPQRIEELIRGVENIYTLPHLRPDILNPLVNGSHERRSLVNMIRVLHTLRAVKSPSEIALMRQSSAINVASFVETLKKVGSLEFFDERAIGARLEYECKIRGAQRMAYPPVVAGGLSATTLHYITNEHLLHPEELVLVDSGCEYNGYASDISRTFPSKGGFNRAQRELYECVLQAHDECIKLCVAGASMDDIHEHSKRVLSNGVSALKITKSPLSSITKIYPHAIGHHLGMDTHDVQFYSDRTLKPGMVITIEPGLYIPPDDEQFYEEFRGMGIRIEDDVLITAGQGPEVLTSGVPTSVDGIESLVFFSPL